VPASVTVASGQSTATFAATAGTLTVDGSATITATLSGVSKTAVITLSAPATLTSLACSPSTVTSGGSSTCTVTLSKAAISNTTVTLASSNASLVVPASVTVASGQATATFLATAGTVTSNQNDMVTASSAGTNVTTLITVIPPTTTAGGLVASYSFNEGSGSTLNDLSGNSNNGTIFGATWTNNGKYGKALSFNGTSSYVDLGNSALLQLTGSMTLSAWIKSAANPPDDGQIIAKSDNTGGWQLKTSPDTGVRTFGMAVSSNSTAHIQRYSSIQPSLSTWYHVAGVYNASTQVMNIYVNGVLVNGTLRGTIPASQFNNAAQHVTIGKRSGGFYFNGVIDELRVYNRALSLAEIQTDMNTPVGVSAPALQTSTTINIAVSGEPSSVEGDPVNLQVAASDVNHLPVTLSASDLPSGSQFDSTSGSFAWEPVGVRSGSYPITFTATNALGKSESAKVMVDVASGAPVLENLLHGATGVATQACSPGALASLQGAGLSRKGESVEVLVNGGYVSVVKSTRKQILFQCPDLPAGTPLSLQAKRGTLWSNTLQSAMAEAAPGIFPLDGAGQPVVAGGELSVLATGLGSDMGQSPDCVSVVVGEVVIPATSMTAVLPGVWRVAVRLPDQIAASQAIPLRLAVRLNGRDLESNTVAITIEERNSELQ
jgi:uncharacterized protein (TIGR03437 family)